MESNLNKNINIISNTPKRNKIKKTILEFPKYMSNEELRDLRKKMKRNIANIEDTHTYLQQNNIFNDTKGNKIYKYIQELNRLENNKNNSIKKNSKIFNKKIENEKNKNRRVLTSINRRVIEKYNKNAPPNILDYIHPHEYYFTHRRIDISNNFEANKEQNDTKNSVLKSDNNQENKLSKLFINKNIYNKSQKKFKNRKNNIFLTLYKKNPNNINSVNSSKLLLDEKSESFFRNNKNHEILNKITSNITTFNKNIRIKPNDEENLNNESSDYNCKIKTTKSIEFKNNNIKNIDINNKNETDMNIKILNDSENNILNGNNKSFRINYLKNNDKNKNSGKKYFKNLNNIILDSNYFCKTSRGFSPKKKYYILSENNEEKTKYRNNSTNIKKRVFSTESSFIRKRKKNTIFEKVNDIDEELNNIKNDIISKKKFEDEDIFKKFEEIKKRTKEDMIVSNILAEKGREQMEMQSMKELFKKMKQKRSFISDLTKQYFTCKKTKYESSIKQKFLKELKKIDLIEKKDALLRDLAYKKNFEIRKGINKLKENDLSKERKIFNNKTVRMKLLNINNMESFIKSMNKY